jgi:hypothetical protein
MPNKKKLSFSSEHRTMGSFKLHQEKKGNDHERLYIQAEVNGIMVNLSVKLDDEGVVVDAWNHPAGECVGTMAVLYNDCDSTDIE